MGRAPAEHVVGDFGHTAVEERFARPGRPAYDAAGGYLGTRLTFSYRRPITGRISVGGGGRIENFSGATNETASRITALVVSPDCGKKGDGGRGWRDHDDNGGRCTIWATPAGGGVWRTDNALAANPDWRRLTDNALDQHSTGALYLDPTDSKHKTLYLGFRHSNRQVRIYAKTEEISRAEIVLRRKWLQAADIERPEDIATLLASE